MANPSFTESELKELAEFVCGRVDSLQELIDNFNPEVVPKSTIRECKSAIRELTSLDTKLRPYHG